MSKGVSQRRATCTSNAWRATCTAVLQGEHCVQMHNHSLHQCAQNAFTWCQVGQHGHGHQLPASPNWSPEATLLMCPLDCQFQTCELLCVDQR